MEQHRKGTHGRCWCVPSQPLRSISLRPWGVNSNVLAEFTGRILSVLQSHTKTQIYASKLSHYCAYEKYNARSPKQHFDWQASVLQVIHVLTQHLVRRANHASRLRRHIPTLHDAVRPQTPPGPLEPYRHVLLPRTLSPVQLLENSPIPVRTLVLMERLVKK